MITGARNSIDVPAPPVAPGGFLAGATVLNVTDGDHSLMGVQYESVACFMPVSDVIGDWCVPPVGTLDCAAGTWTVVNGKTFNGVQQLYEGDPFALYQGVECTMQSMEDNEDQAKQVFDYSERAGIDQRLSAFLAADPDIVDVGTGTPAEVLGKLEANVMATYGGVPLIAIPVELIPMFCQDHLIAPNMDGTFSTCQGSVVVGVVDPSAPGVLYAMGRLILVRGPLNTFNAPPQMIPCPDGSFINSPARALAERIYVPVVECVPYKATVSVP